MFIPHTVIVVFFQRWAGEGFISYAKIHAIVCQSDKMNLTSRLEIYEFVTVCCRRFILSCETPNKNFELFQLRSFPLKIQVRSHFEVIKKDKKCTFLY